MLVAEISICLSNFYVCISFNISVVICKINIDESVCWYSSRKNEKSKEKNQCELELCKFTIVYINLCLNH